MNSSTPHIHTAYQANPIQPSPHRRRLQRTRWLAGVCCVFLITAGCGPAKVTETVSPSGSLPTMAPTAVVDPTATAAPVLPYVQPLTGLPSQTENKDRAFLVTVENSPAARPQTGLSQADLVYEVLAEGEITRFLAVYQSEKPEVIGPVRSMRPYFAEIGVGLGAMLVHAGWSQDGMNMMVKLKADHLDGVYADGVTFWRSKDRKAPHNLYTSWEKIQDGAARHKFSTQWTNPGLSFASVGESVVNEEAVWQPASKVTIPYIMGYKVGYEYDAETGVYNRFMAGQPHVDKDSGKQLTAANVLVIEASHKILDKEGRRAVDVNSSGKGYLIQQGHQRSVTWSRKDGVIRVFANGAELPLVPGKTWIQIVPLGTVPEFS
ncbi:DUF3048 domain-containing protein [Gorillibacterium timonense]|uniref:DUF3048 domain-containing protein n=1 Tax=Gorillibacterium timonense TaxID=1689269 RepID=UPI0009EB36EF|nr:DUF3048 domain-containing protein [Gorillibacterium timonense]